MIEVDRYLPFEKETEIVVVEDSGLLIESNQPVLDGATALLPIYSSVARALYPESSVKYDAETEKFLPGSAMQYSNTLGAYKGIVDGTADIIFVAGPSQQQKDYAAEKGVELEFTPIGREGFVFLVNAKNPVESLTADEIRSIYAGDIKNWKEVGGANRRIHALQRKTGSGSQSSFLRFMGDVEPKKDPLSVWGATIGFSFRFYTEGIVGEDSVKMIAVNGIEPTAENIRNGSYPITSSFFAVTRKNDPNENIQKVLDWILSEKGQEMVNRTGYVGVN